MANNGTKNSNDSQFFITLGSSEANFLFEYQSVILNVLLPTDRADELNGKHTLFGRCVGDTIFSELLHLMLIGLAH